MIVEESGTGSKYIVEMEFVPEVINCDIKLVVVVVLDLVVFIVLFLHFCVATDPPPPTNAD